MVTRQVIRVGTGFLALQEFPMWWESGQQTNYPSTTSFTEP